FGEGINPEDVIIQRRKTSGLNARDSLIITFRNSTDSITIDDFFRAAKYQVEHITFADGTDWLPEDILNYLEDDIPLPIAAPPDTPVSMSLLRQEMAAFSGGEYDDDAGLVVNTTLGTARTTVNSLVSY
ncbi:calcium-binding protein, partial [Kluyvera ascorbata]|uniref:calcium-binding protein n=1 Tax=Kluyvera ascorbata TaxID=51288 RepID=UPI002ABCCF20